MKLKLKIAKTGTKTFEFRTVSYRVRYGTKKMKNRYEAVFNIGSGVEWGFGLGAFWDELKLFRWSDENDRREFDIRHPPFWPKK